MNKTSIPKPIDFATALERTGGEKDFLDELFDMYCEEFEEKYAELKRAVTQKNSDLVRELAHSMKGSSANLSLIPLQNMFYQTEVAGRKKDTAKVEKILPLLRQEFEALKAYLHTNRGQNSNRVEDLKPQNSSIKDLVPGYPANRKSDIQRPKGFSRKSNEDEITVSRNR